MVKWTSNSLRPNQDAANFLVGEAIAGQLAVDVADRLEVVAVPVAVMSYLGVEHTGHLAAEEGIHMDRHEADIAVAVLLAVLSTGPAAEDPGVAVAGVGKEGFLSAGHIGADSHLVHHTAGEDIHLVVVAALHIQT